jgi:hypothetical protein
LLDGRLAGAVAHLCELLLVAGELGIELGEFYIEAFYARVDLCVLAGAMRGLKCAYIGNGAVERRLGRRALGSEEAVHGAMCYCS